MLTKYMCFNFLPTSLLTGIAFVAVLSTAQAQTYSLIDR